MLIRFTKLSDEEHRVQVTRRDGSSEQATLVSRSFLRHDLAHLAVEECVGLDQGFWGSVAKGASLDGADIRGPQPQLAEALAAPVQTLMRDQAPVERYEATLAYILPDRDCAELAQQVEQKVRQLIGHWRATPFGETMEIKWHEQD